MISTKILIYSIFEQTYWLSLSDFNLMQLDSFTSWGDRLDLKCLNVLQIVKISIMPYHTIER